jgi:hypothetical protein
MSEYDVQKFDAVKNGYVGTYAIKIERAHYQREAERLSRLCKKLQEKLEKIEKVFNEDLT